jgi:hypothetical protein
MIRTMITIVTALAALASPAHAADRFRLKVCIAQENGDDYQCTTARFDNRAKCEQTRQDVGKRLLMPPPIPPMVLHSAGKCERD